MSPEEEQQKPDGTGMDGGTAIANYCRQSANMAIRAFVNLLLEAEENGQVPLAAMARIAEVMTAKDGPMAAFYERAETACRSSGVQAAAAAARNRIDHVNRLIAEPFAFLLELPDSGIARSNLPQFFAAIRTMLGEDTYQEMKAGCAAIADHHRDPDGLVNWSAFHADPRARAILDDILVTIARSFHRFEARWDWLLSRMNTPASQVAPSSAAFLHATPEDKAAQTFTDAHLLRLFRALFASMRPEAFDTAGTAAFSARWGTKPERVFGPFFLEMNRLAERQES